MIRAIIHGTMVPPEFANFFLGSTGASATLIGLLFIAVSIEPERVFGSGASAEQQATAAGAFTALANVFFISLGALIPNTNLGGFVLVMGAIGHLTRSPWDGGWYGSCDRGDSKGDVPRIRRCLY